MNDSNDKMVVVVKEIKEVPAGFTLVDAVPGRAAHAYIMDEAKLETLVTDPRYIGYFIESYGYHRDKQIEYEQQNYWEKHPRL
jgi:uncharacterized protein (DUF2141 family)